MRLRWPFPPACGGKGNHGVGQKLAVHGRGYACNDPFLEGLIGFSPSGTGKRLSGVSRDWLFSLPVNEKVVSVQLDWISPLPVEENSVSGGFPPLTGPAG